MHTLNNTKFNTQPKVLHFPGRCYRKNHNSIILYNQAIQPNITFNTFIPDNCAITTIASANIINTMLFDQADRLSIDLIRLGADIPKKNFNTYYKLTKMLEFVNNTDKEIILSVDANDILFIDDIKTIFNEYIKLYSDKIIFSGEKKFSYFFKRSRIFQHEQSNIRAFLKSKSNTEYNSLNSGLYIGNTSLLRQTLPLIIDIHDYAKSQDPHMRSTDQSAWMYAWYKYDLKHVQLDDMCSMFQTCHALSDTEIELKVI